MLASAVGPGSLDRLATTPRDAHGHVCALAGWVLGYAILFTIQMTSAGLLVPAGWTIWFLDVNPYWLALEPVVSPGTYRSE